MNLGLLDKFGTSILVQPLAGENPGTDNHPFDTRWHAQRGITHIAGFFAKDGAQQFFLRRQLGLTFRRDLADQDIGRLDFRADPYDAAFIEIAQGIFAEVGDIVGDFFLAQLGIAGNTLELLDVNRGVAILLDQLFGDQDRVLEVVATPGHESDQDILAEGQLAPLGGRSVGDNLATFDLVADLDDRLLVQAGVLVGTDKLDQVVDINAGASLIDFVVVDLDDDTTGVNAFNHTIMTGNNCRAGVVGDNPLHACSNQRSVGTQQRHSLALHVGAHQGAVGVVILEERDKGRSNRDQLLR